VNASGVKNWAQNGCNKGYWVKMGEFSPSHNYTMHIQSEQGMGVNWEAILAGRNGASGSHKNGQTIRFLGGGWYGLTDSNTVGLFGDVRFRVYSKGANFNMPFALWMYMPICYGMGSFQMTASSESSVSISVDPRTTGILTEAQMCTEMKGFQKFENITLAAKSASGNVPAGVAPANVVLGTTYALSTSALQSNSCYAP
jgi:hypothetical protein